MRKIIFLIFILIVGFYSCIKEDLSNISGIELESEWLIPLFDLNLDVVDVLSFQEIDEHYTDSDSLIHIVIREDSLILIEAESILSFNQQQTVDFDFTIGEIILEDFSSQTQVTLADISSQLDSNDAQMLVENSSEGPSYFPPINISYGGTYYYDSFEDFDFIEIDSGNITLQLHNTFQVEIESISLAIQNQVTQEIIAEFDFYDVGIGEVENDVINLSNLIIHNALSIVVQGFSTQGSGSDPNDSSSWLDFNLTDVLNFEITASNFNVVAGMIIFPNTELEEDTITMVFEGPEESIMESIEFNSGLLEIECTSSISHPAEILIEIPSLNNSGDSFSQSITISESSSQPNLYTWPLMGYSLEEINNDILIQYSGNILSNNQMLNFDAQDSVNFHVKFRDISLSFAQGYFGQKEIILNQESYDLPDFGILDPYLSDIDFVNPKLFIKSKNSIGVPLELNLNIVGENEFQQQALEIQPFMINPPNISSLGEEVEELFEFNSSNSSIIEMVSVFPDEIYYSGSVMTNPNANIETNFIENESKIEIGFEIDIPAEINIDNLIYTDTLSIPEIETENYDTVQLRIFIGNDFPLEGSFKAMFLDSISQTILDSVFLDDIPAAPVNQNGETIESSNTEYLIDLNENQISSIANANQAKIKVRLSSTNSQSNIVKIYADDKFNLSIGVKVLFE